jgi:hypothetical protein
VNDPPREHADDIPGAVPRWVVAFTLVIGLLVILALCVGVCGNPFGPTAATTMRAPRPTTNEPLMAVVGGVAGSKE